MKWDGFAYSYLPGSITITVGYGVLSFITIPFVDASPGNNHMYFPRIVANGSVTNNHGLTAMVTKV